jgi:nitrogen PTS system EIIA component
MDLTVSDAAELLGVSDQVCYRLIRDEGFPAQWVNGRPVINHVDLIEWATARRMHCSPALFRANGSNGPSLVAALEAGGVHENVPGSDAASIVSNALNLIPLPSNVDRPMLQGVIVNHMQRGNLVVIDGIAIPHARLPAVLDIEKPILSVLRPSHPFTPAGKQGLVHTLILLLSPSIRQHLQLLARLAGALSNKDIHDAVIRRIPQSELIALLSRCEATAEASTHEKT